MVLFIAILIAIIQRRSRKKDNHSRLVPEHSPKTPKRTPKPRYVNTTLTISNPAFGEDMEDRAPSDSSSSADNIKETVIDMEKQDEPVEQQDGGATKPPQETSEVSEGDRKSDKTQTSEEERPLVVPLVVISDETEGAAVEEMKNGSVEVMTKQQLQESAREEERETQSGTEEGGAKRQDSREGSEGAMKADEETTQNGDEKPVETTGSEEGRDIQNGAAAAEQNGDGNEARTAEEEPQESNKAQDGEAVATVAEEPEESKDKETGVELRERRDGSEEREMDEQRRGSLIESENEQEYVIQGGEVSDGGEHSAEDTRRLEDITEEHDQRQQQQPEQPAADVAEGKPTAKVEDKPTAEQQESAAAERAVQSEMESNMDDDDYQEPDTVITLI